MGCFFSPHTHTNTASLKMHGRLWSRQGPDRQFNLRDSGACCREIKPDWHDAAEVTELSFQLLGFCTTVEWATATRWAAVSEGCVYKCAMEEERNGERGSLSTLLCQHCRTELNDRLYGDGYLRAAAAWVGENKVCNQSFFFFPFCVGTVGPGVLVVSVSWALCT